MYINAYIWNLEKSTDERIQSSCGYADIQNTLMDKGRGEEAEGGVNGQSSMKPYTLIYVK